MTSPTTARICGRNVRYIPPYDWSTILAFFRARAIPGVEDVDESVYRRTVSIDGDVAIVVVRHEPVSRSLAVDVVTKRTNHVPALLARVRRAFDTDADNGLARAQLSRDALLAPLLAARPGLRVPGGWDAFEVGVRAILGQQITVAGARQLAGRLVSLCGTGRPEASPLLPQLSHAFPSAEQVLNADLDALGMPASRRATLRALARAATVDPDLFARSASVEQTVARLRAIPGIGEWTAQYIAMRAVRESDAFPATDVGLLRGATVMLRAKATSGELLRRAEAWRPWRAYAAQHLWAVDGGRLGDNKREVRHE